MTPDDTSVRNLASVILAAQPFVPRSPADDAGNLCLAAALAKAGFLLQGDDAAAQLLHQTAMQSHSKDVLYAAFDCLGWSSAQCTERLTFNDTRPEEMRKQRVLECLRQKVAAT